MTAEIVSWINQELLYSDKTLNNYFIVHLKNVQKNIIISVYYSYSVTLRKEYFSAEGLKNPQAGLI